MLDQILNTVKQITNETVAGNTQVPDAQKPAVAEAAFSSIQNGVQDALKSGNIASVIDLFKGKNGADNTTANNISGNFINEITSKLGSGNSNGALGNILPTIFSKISSVIGEKSFGDAGGLESILTKASGFLDTNKDGKVDLKDAESLLGGKSGGLWDTLKNMFGGKK